MLSIWKQIFNPPLNIHLIICPLKQINLFLALRYCWAWQKQTPWERKHLKKWWWTNRSGIEYHVAERQECNAPIVNKKVLLEKRLDILYTCTEPYPLQKPIRCKTELVGVGKNNIVDINWSKEYLQEGDLPVAWEHYCNNFTSRTVAMRHGGGVMTRMGIESVRMGIIIMLCHLGSQFRLQVKYKH